MENWNAIKNTNQDIRDEVQVRQGRWRMQGLLKLQADTLPHEDILKVQGVRHINVIRNGLEWKKTKLAACLTKSMWAIQCTC